MDVSPATTITYETDATHVTYDTHANGPMTVQSFVSSQRPKWLLKILIEVAFISMGVFLALMGEQWRERAHTRELARGSLQRFRVELVRNRKAVEAVKDYHKSVLAGLQRYMDADAAQRNPEQVRVRGLQPAILEHTAWDLALATQSLADLDPALAFELSRIYGLQTRYDDVTRSILQAIYIRPVGENLEGLYYYYGDAVIWDTALLKMYQDILPQIDRVLRSR
jgi:hypothetical protein